MTEERIQKSNERKYLAFEIMRTGASAVVTGAILTAFLRTLGVSDAENSLFSALTQIAQVAAMAAFAFFCDKVRGVGKAAGAAMALMPIGLAIYIAAAFAQSPSAAVYRVALAGGLVYNFFSGVLISFLYRLPGAVIPRERFGALAALGGTASGVIAVLVTLAVALGAQAADPRIVTSIAFGIGIAAHVTAAVLGFSFRLPPAEKDGAGETETAAAVDAEKAEVTVGAESEEKRSAEKREKTHGASLLRYPPFTLLIVPNFLRGFGFGILLLVVLAGEAAGAIDDRTAYIVPFVTHAATIIGNLIYRFAERRAGWRRLILVSGIGIAAFMPLTAAFGNAAPFFAFYFLAYGFQAILALAVPVAVYEIVEPSVIGKYSVWRMLVYTLGLGIPGFFFTEMLGALGAAATMLIGGVCQLLCAVAYLFVARHIRRADPLPPLAPNR